MMPTKLTKHQRGGGAMAYYLLLILPERKHNVYPFQKSFLLFLSFSVAQVLIAIQHVMAVDTVTQIFQKHIEVHLAALKFSVRPSFIDQNFTRIIDNCTPSTSDILIKF